MSETVIMWHGVHASNEVHLESGCCPGSCMSIMNLLSCVCGVSQPACDPVVVDSIFAARNLKHLSGSAEVALGAGYRKNAIIITILCIKT